MIRDLSHCPERHLSHGTRLSVAHSTWPPDPLGHSQPKYLYIGGDQMMHTWEYGLHGRGREDAGYRALVWPRLVIGVSISVVFTCSKCGYMAIALGLPFSIIRHRAQMVALWWPWWWPWWCKRWGNRLGRWRRNLFTRGIWKDICNYSNIVTGGRFDNT